MKRLEKICIHAFFWLFFVFLMNSEDLGLAWGLFSRESGSIILPLLYGTAIGALIFYLNIYLLIPDYFSKGKKATYWLLACLLLLIACLFESLLDYLVITNRNSQLFKPEFTAALDENMIDSLVIVFINTLTANFVCWIFAFAYRFPKDWIKNERQKNQLEKDKLQAELDFLKAQINPHFLFNGINSIYHLIGEDNETAKNTLLRFSGLLRYQLYEGSVSYISLKKELEYINNYINIEEVRKGEDAVFDFNLPDIKNHAVLDKHKIAPLLITPFLENAFKYISHYSHRNKNFIKLNLTIDEKGKLTMNLSNSYDNTFKLKNESEGGIGLKNVKRRLDLLYPNGKHELKINSIDNVFKVNLKLDLNEN